MIGSQFLELCRIAVLDCEWRLLGEAPPRYNGTSVPSKTLTDNLNAAWAGEGIDEDTAFPLFPGKSTCIQVLGQ